MKEKIKVLVIGAGSFVYRGVESYLLGIYENIDHEEIAMDFLTPLDCKNENIFRALAANGNQVIELKLELNRKFKKQIDLYMAIKHFLRNHDYDVIYINTGSSLTMATEVAAAYHNNIPYRIVHAHNSGNASIRESFIRFTVAYSLSHYPSEYLSCSNEATRHVFPKKCWNKAIFIPNGINIDKYSFNLSDRNTIRKKYNLNLKKVIGNVGALIEQKNHEFLLRAFKKAYEKDKELYLVIIGEGDCAERINKKIKKLGIEDAVLMLGKTHEVSRWLSAFDIFALPSIFEGLPVSVVEAQASGLVCLLSDRITKEVCVTDRVHYLSIDDENVWSEQFVSMNMVIDSRTYVDQRLNIFDVKKSAKKIEDIILSYREKQ